MNVANSAQKSIELLPLEVIERRIFLIRGMKVMLDADLAELYGVTTKRLNEQVKRNKERFPVDFIFQLTESEKNKVVANCDHLRQLKFSHHLPHAFTEHGVAMLSSVLKSPQSIEMNIYIIRAFIKLREVLATHRDLAQKIEELGRKQRSQDSRIETIQMILSRLISEPKKPSNPIGFSRK